MDIAADIEVNAERSTKRVCPITDLMDVISAKWVVEILRELAIRPTRTTQFLTHIPGLTMKILRERLSMLERSRLIEREESVGRPLKVEYSVTEFGRRAFFILMEMKTLASQMQPAACRCSFEVCGGREESIDCPRRRARVRSYGEES
jgi:DNA-binding HxlR family transcriptional regulator